MGQAQISNQQQNSFESLIKNPGDAPGFSVESSARPQIENVYADIQAGMKLGRLLAEKCELKQADEQLRKTLELIRALAASETATQGHASSRLIKHWMETLSTLLWLAGNSGQNDRISQWESELDAKIVEHPENVHPLVWHCKGSIARSKHDYSLAQNYFHLFLRAVKEITTDSPHVEFREEWWLRAWTMLAVTSFDRGRMKRSRSLVEKLLSIKSLKWEASSLGVIHLLMAHITEKEGKFDLSLQSYQKAYSEFIQAHHWYYHFYVLCGFARIARFKGQYAQAYWYLDLVEKAIAGQEYGTLRTLVTTERKSLEDDAVDLLIDSRKGIIKTRDHDPVSLKKQYVLLHILEALTQAHSRDGGDYERGLTKAEIIEMVWKERYRPEAHDNKLYYNINRLRKLIEPDIKTPRYLLNWKEGYRLAPGLRVQLLNKSALVEPAVVGKIGI